MESSDFASLKEIRRILLRDLSRF